MLTTFFKTPLLIVMIVHQQRKVFVESELLFHLTLSLILFALSFETRSHYIQQFGLELSVCSTLA